MLCQVCSRIFSSRVERGDHHTSLEPLNKAATDGCYICARLSKYARKCIFDLKFLFGSDTKFSYLWNSPTFYYELGLLRFEILSSIHFEVWGVDRSEWEFPRKFLLVPQTMLPVRTSVFGRRSTISINDCLPVAQEWMSSCLDNHEQCQKHTQPHTYPTRLLELGTKNLRLILPEDDRPSGPYAALSYCWGPNPSFIRLTADNLQEFRAGLPYASLPIAFQEAIHITKKLGIQYFWIDALCIIQSGLGSNDDWQSESARMQDVYSNCILNLSLAQAAHPDQSCLGGYNLDCTLPFEVDVINRVHGRGSRGTHRYTVVSVDYFKEALYGQPIGGRAWVMQERLLATRVLSIGHGELFWDCQQVPHASESLPCGFANYSAAERNVLNKDMDLPIPFIPRTLDSKDLEDSWFKIVKEYTARELTRPQTDKLVALSAISTRMGYAMNDTYLCGHFRKMLPASLNWCVHRGQTPAIRDKLREPKRLPPSSGQMISGDWIITPSWSWASMNGPLNMLRTQARDETFVAAMEDYSFSPLIQTGPETRLEKKLLLTIRTWCQIIDWSKVEPRRNRGLEIVPGEPFGLSFVMDDMSDLPEDRSQCLLAALGLKGYMVQGLLLRETNFDGNKVYERLGHFTWLLSPTNEFTQGSWKTVFTYGERLITLC